MKKRFLLIIFSLIMCVTSVCSINVMASEGSIYAWPGRPGGNGDGSEEWLQGEYGETNGPYKDIYFGQGKVSDFGISSKTEAIASFIISAGVAKIDPYFAGAVTIAGLVAALGAPDYEGAYYKLVSAVSGRSMRITVDTYRNENYTGHEATYVEYVAW